MGVEPTTLTLARSRSTTELHPQSYSYSGLSLFMVANSSTFVAGPNFCKLTSPTSINSSHTSLTVMPRFAASSKTAFSTCRCKVIVIRFMVSPVRIERTTFRLGGKRSIQLSYGDVDDHPASGVTVPSKVPSQELESCLSG